MLRPETAVVIKGGPENGPFSALALRTIIDAGYAIKAIYACSGSTPTALFGCVGDLPKLCHLWANITPREIVGDINMLNTSLRVLNGASMLTSEPLKKFLSKHCDFDRIFSADALPIKFPAVDLLSNEYIIFSNKNPKHKKWFLEGVMGSMALIPFLPPQFVFDPEESELIEKGKTVHKALMLVDGGYLGNMLLGEAMKDGYEDIFLIDIHGLTPAKFNLNSGYKWPNIMRSCVHLLSNKNDRRQFREAEQLNEIIEIRDEFYDLAGELPDLCSEKLMRIIKRMDEGRLRLKNKNRTRIFMVSNEGKSILFNFAKFTDEPRELMYAGQEAALKTIRELDNL